MPRVLRNWWISGHVDGRKTPFTAGPRSGDGGFDLSIRQNHNGTSLEVLRVHGRAAGESPDELTLSVTDCVTGNEIHRFVTQKK